MFATPFHRSFAMSTLRSWNQACGTAFRAFSLRRLGWTTSLRTPPGEASTPSRSWIARCQDSARVALRACSMRPSAWRKTAVPVRSRGSGGRPPGRSASRRCATAARRPSRRCGCAGRGPRDGSPRCPPAAAASRPPPSRCGPCRRPARRSRSAGRRTTRACSRPMRCQTFFTRLVVPWRDRPSCSVRRAVSRRAPACPAIARSCAARCADAQRRRVQGRRHGLQRAALGEVAGQDPGAAREAAGVQHQAQREQRTVVALLPGMAAACQRLPVRRALEARAGPVVQGDGGLQVEQVGGALEETRLDRVAVAQ